MFVRWIRIQNYRSFQDVEMTFSEQANYLVGENSIGKSSFLRLLLLLSSGTGILESDYYDVEKPLIITAELKLLLTPGEYFADAPTDRTQFLRVRLEKRVEELFPRLYNDQMNQPLPLDLLRRLRYVFHSSLHSEEQVASAYIQKRLEQVLGGQDRTEGLLGSQEVLSFIRREESFSKLDAAYYTNIVYLSKLLSRQEHSRADNMKFISMVALKLVSQIYLMYHSRAVPLEHTVICDEQGHRYLPLLVAIDEPEVHLHPYMQRSILTYYKQILANEDKSFCQLLKKLFNLDGLRGQLFIVTHATDALVDDYRNIIRFYRDGEGMVRAACGATFNFSEEIEKHLIMHFPEVKEALYSRSVIIVEGETEYGCFQLFGTTLDLRFDYYGICLINARGESSIVKIKRLLEYFKIPVVALYDADVKEGRQGERNVFFTDEICFEMDLAKAMLTSGKRAALDGIMQTLLGFPAHVSGDMLKKACHKLQLDRHTFAACRLDKAAPAQAADLAVYYFAWLYSNKGVILGRLLGQSLTQQEIPPAFARVIREAGRLAKA